MADAPTLRLPDLRAIVTDAGELAKGAKIVDDGGLAHLARYQHKLYADAAGSQTYKVQIAFEDKGPRGRCSCMAARSRPFCKHAAALLVAWARTPEAFAVAETAPAGPADGKKKAVKTGKVDAAELMRTGVAQVTTLVRELALAGVAAMADDRAAQVRALGANLREQKLRRLGAKTVAMADLLEARDQPSFDESAYAELLAELVLTARKLDKHLAGEPLDPRHVEELIGKTWTKKDRAPVAGLELVEVAFASYETADDYLIRDSRLIELTTGAHYCEKQILPRFLAKRTPAKPSYAGLVLTTDGSLFPSYPPHRLDLEVPRRRALDAAAVARLRATALPDVKAALAALQEHRKDLFAPDALPVTIACDMVVADGGHLRVVDASSAALFLPDEAGLVDRLATALAGAALRAIIGDLALEGALPVVTPLAVIVEGRHGLELRSLVTLDPTLGSRKLRLATPAAAGPSRWAATARAVGLSTAAIALGEVREELAALLFAGLTSVTPRRVESLVARLRELALAKPADTLAALAARDAEARLDDLIKLHQVLGIALMRLTGAAAVERGELEASPMYASVYVRGSAERSTPAEIARRVARGELDRFTAAARYARYYEAIPGERLIDEVFPTWADGSAAPFVALAARAHPARAVAEAAALLDEGAGGERRGRRGRPLQPPRMATITALRVLEEVGGDAALAGLRHAADRHRDACVRALARAALARSTGAPLPDLAARLEARAALVNAASKDDRARAAEALADLGDTDALPLLRLSFAGDVAFDVRDAAGRALGRLGDGDSVDTFVAALARRGRHHDPAMTAALALGHLGDVRGVQALLEAYEAAWRPDVVTDALVAVGPAAVPQVVAFVEARPGLLKRATARAVIDALAADALRAAIVDRLDGLPAADVAAVIGPGAALLDLAKGRAEVARPVAAHLLQRWPALAAKGASREARALARKAEAAQADPA